METNNLKKLLQENKFILIVSVIGFITILIVFLVSGFLFATPQVLSPSVVEKTINDRVANSITTNGSNDSLYFVALKQFLSDYNDADVEVSANSTTATAELNMKVSGATGSTTDKAFAFKGILDATLKTSKGQSASVNAGLIIIDKNFYFNVLDIKSDQELVVTQLSTLKGKWYRLKNVTPEQAIQSFTGINLNKSIGEEGGKALVENKLLHDTASAGNKLIAGEVISCVISQLGELKSSAASRATERTSQLEICRKPSAVVPVYLGWTVDNSPNKLNLGFTVNKYLDKPIEISAPDTAIDFGS